MPQHMLSCIGMVPISGHSVYGQYLSGNPSLFHLILSNITKQLKSEIHRIKYYLKNGLVLDTSNRTHCLVSKCWSPRTSRYAKSAVHFHVKFSVVDLDWLSIHRLFNVIIDREFS